MYKPKILILMHYLELGGAEMALIGLLKALDPSNVDVDLFLYDHRGPLMEFIPEWVNLLPEKKAYKMIERPMTEALKNGRIGVVTGRILAKIKHRRYLRNLNFTGQDQSQFGFIGECVTPFLPAINPEREYDLCISFLTPHNIGRDKVRAKKRLAWIHTDYSTVHINANGELPVWNGYDNIASISDEVTKAFLGVFPSLKEKIIPIENILSSDFIFSRAKEPIPEKEMNAAFKLLSIGRFTYAKNFDNVPAIAKEMVKLGMKNFKWFIIGYGGEEKLIREKIHESGMEEYVIIFGKKDNPYPYIKACDVYVQPSRYEGKSITVREAQIMKRPVAVAAFPTASSQINNGVDGVILPQDNIMFAKGLKEFVQDKALQNRIVSYLEHNDYTRISETAKIYSLLSNS